MNLRGVLSRYKKPSRESAWVCGRMANGRLALEGEKRKRQISICRLRGCGGHGAVQTGEMVASAPIIRVRARNPNKKMASLAMKSPTQSVRYRVRRAGATPSGRARSIGRGWEDCQGSGCFSTDPAKAYKYGSDEGRALVDFGLQPWRDVSTPEISHRSRLAGEGAVSPDIYVSDRTRSPASRLLQTWTQTHCRSALARERDPSAPPPCHCHCHRHCLIHRVRQQVGS
jgi:hypothetical protein